MGFLFFMMLLSFVALSAYSFLANSKDRKKIMQTWSDRPVHSAYVALALSLVLGFFLGVMIRPLGDIYLFDRSITLWQFCGTGIIFVIIVPFFFGVRW